MKRVQTDAMTKPISIPQKAGRSRGSRVSESCHTKERGTKLRAQRKGDVEPRDLSKTKQEVAVTKMLSYQCALVPVLRLRTRKMQPIPLVFVL